MEFTDKITLTWVNSKKQYRENSIWIRTQRFNKVLKLNDDEYFVFFLPPDYTDGASIPRYLWWIIAPRDWRILIPSQPHDYIYRLLKENNGKDIKIKGKVWNKRTNAIIRDGVVVNVSRKDGDMILFEKMESYGGEYIRYPVLAGVRIGGYFVVKYKL